MKKIAITALLAVLAGQAWAVNKCTLPDGRITFQDAPCAGSATGEVMTIRPASGYVTAAPQEASQKPAATSSAPSENGEKPKPKTHVQKMQDQITNSQNERRRQELEMRFIPETTAAINNNNATCDGQIQELKDRKLRANNNLAGATLEQSLSTEMLVISTRCEARTTELRTALDSLKKECKSLGGCR